MRRKTLRAISRVPGLYTLVAFLMAARVTVRGESMAPALLPGERLLVDRLAYVRDRPREGDLMLIRHPFQSGLKIVKRLEAVPGEVVGAEQRALGCGEYWVGGDNPDWSTDSREFGPVHRSNLIGRVWVRYWPAELWHVFSD